MGKHYGPKTTPMPRCRKPLTDAAAVKAIKEGYKDEEGKA